MPQRHFSKKRNETKRIELVKEELEHNDMWQGGEKRQRETIRRVRVAEMTSK
jgi:hypothetical protein